MMHEEVEVTEADREKAREIARDYEDYLSAVSAMGTGSDPSEVIAEFVAYRRLEQERLRDELKIVLHDLEKVNARLRHILCPQPPE